MSSTVHYSNTQSTRNHVFPVYVSFLNVYVSFIYLFVYFALTDTNTELLP